MPAAEATLFGRLRALAVIPNACATPPGINYFQRLERRHHRCRRKTSQTATVKPMKPTQCWICVRTTVSHIEQRPHTGTDTHTHANDQPAPNMTTERHTRHMVANDTCAERRRHGRLGPGVALRCANSCNSSSCSGRFSACDLYTGIDRGES